jgi:DNA-binding beta-propeller fold protein YncE
VHRSICFVVPFPVGCLVGCLVALVLALGIAAPADARQACSVFGTFDRQFDGFERPTSIAVAPDGRVAVIERDARRIRLLAPTGEEVLRIDPGSLSDGGPWQVALAPTDAGPTAAAFAPDGRLAILAPGRIAIFESNGLPWRTLSGATDAAAALVEPVAAAFGPAGELWIADRGAGAVVAFDSELKPLRRIDGVVARPGGIVVLEDGGIFVSDEDAHAVVRLSAEGAEVDRFGERGAFPGLLNVPTGLVIVGECLYVADELNHRISIHRFDGRFVGQWGMHAVVPREGEGKIHYPRSIAATPDGTAMWVAEPFERRLQRFTLSDPAKAMATSMPTFEGVQSHFGAAVASDGDLLVLEEPETASVFVFDLRPASPVHVATFGGHGEKLDTFGRITAVAVDASAQRIWVADSGNHRLALVRLDRDRAAGLKLDPFMPRLVRSYDLRRLSEKARAAAGVPSRTRPLELVGFARDRTGRMWTLDATEGLLVAIDDRLVPTNAAATGLAGASGLAFVASEGERTLFASTRPDAREVVVFDATGAVVARTGGGLEQPFGRPTAVAVLDGKLLVTDAATDRIVVLELRGDALVVATSIGERGMSDGQFWAPDGIAVLPPPTEPTPLGQVNATISAVLHDAKNAVRCVVVDRGNHRAQVLALGGFAQDDPDAEDAAAAAGLRWIMTFGLGRAYTRPRDRGSS